MDGPNSILNERYRPSEIELNKRFLLMAYNFRKGSKLEAKIDSNLAQHLVHDDWAFVGKSKALKEAERAWQLDPTRKKPEKVKDHMVPVVVLRDKSFQMFNDKKQTYSIRDVARFLRRNFKVAMITKEEDDRLLQMSMPRDNWEYSDERYKAANIEIDP